MSSIQTINAAVAAPLVLTLWLARATLDKSMRVMWL